MQKKLKSFLSTALLVLSSYGTSFGRGNNCRNYSSGSLYRNELINLDNYDDDEFYYNPHHAEKTNKNLYWAVTTAVSPPIIWKLLESSYSKTESNVDGKVGNLSSESEKDVTDSKKLNGLNYENNANMISFADAKKEIDKISLRNIGNTCYINTFMQAVLQFPRLIDLIKGVDETKIKERLNNEKQCNFLTGVHRLVVKITEDKQLSYDDWDSCTKLMGHVGNTGVANDFWEKLLDTIKEYYGYYWGRDEKGKNIYCPAKSINELVLDATVFDAPLDVKEKVINEMKKQYLSEEKKLFRNSLHASFGILRITIPSYLEALEKRGGKKLKGLENAFEKFTINTNGNQEIWTDYDKKVEKAEANLKAITINYPGHWIAYTKHDDGYYKHNDGRISKISKEDMMNEIKKNPIGTALLYSISEIK